METKICRQCGEIKPITEYRKYYGGRSGTYTLCKLCEKINSREKYLTAKGESITWAEEAELGKIHKLYEVQRQAGLRPPRKGGQVAALADDLDSMIDKYHAPAPKGDVIAVPPELNKWLTCVLTDDPDTYTGEVYDKLVETYAPVKSIDNATMMPVRDDTYKAALDRILQRFYDYEDNYYSKED